MSKMGEELDRRLDANKYELYETCKKFMEEMRDTRNRQWATCYREQLEKAVWQVIAKVEK